MSFRAIVFCFFPELKPLTDCIISLPELFHIAEPSPSQNVDRIRLCKVGNS
jgi:hypothetical protein